MRHKILGLLIVILTSCGESDNFHEVSRVIDAPDSVTLGKEFEFRLTIKNASDKKIKLTIDRNVTKSIQFLPDWTCDNDLIVHKVPNPRSMDNDFQTHYLNRNDSLTYNLKGQLTSYGADSLEFSIDNYDRVFRFRKPKCKIFEMTLGGIWLPSNGPVGDSMEGYNFGQKIEIRE